MRLLSGHVREVPDSLPPEIRKRKGFESKAENLRKIHFPNSPEEFAEARAQLAYEELFSIQYAGIARKYELRKESEGFAPAVVLDAERVKSVLASLPFQLTGKQKISLFQILKDMEKPHSMARLLQGDVGTGKTAVAFVAAIHAYL